MTETHTIGGHIPWQGRYRTFFFGNTSQYKTTLAKDSNGSHTSERTMQPSLGVGELPGVDGGVLREPEKQQQAAPTPQ